MNRTESDPTPTDPTQTDASADPAVAADSDPATDLLTRTIAAIRPLDEAAMAAAEARQAQLTKPAGSMGRLEPLGTQLAGIAGACPPPIPRRAVVVVMAGDHGVHAQGVSPWPQEVTVQMIANVAAGGAVVSALARQVGAEVMCVDVGVAGELVGTLPSGGAQLMHARIADGTADLATGPAMTREEALVALEVGISVADRLAAQGIQIVVTGDLGIGNTTASAALLAAYTGRPAEEVTGRGAGSDDAMLAHKTSIVAGAVARQRARADGADPLGILAALGGFEHAALAGLIIGAAAHRLPVLLDGVIAGSAALAARALAPACAAYLIAGHRSSEPGATAALADLDLSALLDLDLRLGEGSGGALAVPLVQAAARLLHEVATFDSAGVAERAES